MWQDRAPVRLGPGKRRLRARVGPGSARPLRPLLLSARAPTLPAAPQQSGAPGVSGDGLRGGALWRPGGAARRLETGQGARGSGAAASRAGGTFLPGRSRRRPRAARLRSHSPVPDAGFAELTIKPACWFVQAVFVLKADLSVPALRERSNYFAPL